MISEENATRPATHGWSGEQSGGLRVPSWMEGGGRRTGVSKW